MFEHKSTKYIVGGLLVVIVLSWLIGPFLKKESAPTATPTAVVAVTEEPTEEATPVPPPTATPTEEPTAEATPTVVETEEATPEAEVDGDWVGVGGGGTVVAIGYLGVCNAWSDPYFPQPPTPDELTVAVEAYPALPDGMLVMSAPIYMPRSGMDSLTDDVNAFLQTPEYPVCQENPWTDEAVETILNSDDTLNFFGIARPVTTPDGDAWEVLVYARVRQE